ncbi:MAG TPA: 2-oxo-4-hydroxy-4-carboxy-5-ureidoimidazoline decarboxylase [Terracidiphilus sp.]|jgi:OHCU decarboxylase|nr:2-oxo-4-hydroxy-4-carboxy-5-ureidoimidazoline decarboxylase [Terracidiphilus sp.]
MSPVLDQWNRADEAAAVQAMLACCGARRWAEKMVARRPFASLDALSAAADEEWNAMGEDDWLEAFASHPRIGQRVSDGATSPDAAWSRQEQSLVSSAGESIRAALAEANARYYKRFGFTFIVCATGKSADEMLAILERRLQNERAAELQEAAEQQRRIMQLRLRKWVAS